MEVLFFRVAVVSAALAVVLLPLLVLPHWRKRYAPHTRRAVWLAIALVLLAAPLLPKAQAPVQITIPEHTVTIPLEVPPAAQNTAVSGQNAATVPIPGTQTAAQSPQTVEKAEAEERMAHETQWGTLLTVVWLAGVAAILLWQGTVYLLVRRRMMRGAVVLDEYDELAAELCPRRSVRFFRVKGVVTPMTLGAVRAVVLLPEGEVRTAALRHELIHVRRWDVGWKMLMLLACAVHWFNPLVWIMSRRSEQDMEASCDAVVVEEKDAAFRRSYGELLLNTASARRVPLTTRFGGGKKLMKARLYDLFHPGKRSRVFVGLVLLLCFAAGSLVACQQKEESKDEFQVTDNVADGIYCAPAPGYAETGGETNYSLFTLTEYDPETGERGETLGEVVLPLADDLMLRGLNDEEYSGIGDLSPENRRKRFFAFLNWPMLRAMLYPGMMDLLEVHVEDGEVTALRWFQVPSAIGELADGTYCATMPGFVETNEEIDYCQLEFTLFGYDPSTGEQGLRLGTITLPLAKDLVLQGGFSSEARSLAEVDSEVWERSIVNFVGWPMLRSTYAPNVSDRMEVHVENGEVTFLRWFQVPLTQADDYSLEVLEDIADFFVPYMKEYSILMLDANELTNTVDIALGNYNSAVISELKNLASDASLPTDCLNFLDWTGSFNMVT